MRRLPLGGNIGLCGRWVIPLVFCVGVLTALGVQTIFDRPGEWSHRLALAGVALGMFDAFIVGAPLYRYLFGSPYSAPPRLEFFRQYWNDSPGNMVASNQNNLGALNCSCCGYHIPHAFAVGFNQPGYRDEFYLLAAGRVKQTLWTPNRPGYEINPSEPTSLVIDQNMYPGWRLVKGEGEVYSEPGLIAVRVARGHQEIEILYRPTHIEWAYLLVSFATAMLCIVWWLERWLSPHPGFAATDGY
jgi:hypothetical protein